MLNITENSEASSEEGDYDNGLSVDEILSGVNEMLENDKVIFNFFLSKQLIRFYHNCVLPQAR